MANESHDSPHNPYVAPQSRELSIAKSVETLDTSTSPFGLPCGVQRWQMAAIIMYFVAFIVPYAPWTWSSGQDWRVGMGFFLLTFGAVNFWNPFVFPSW